MKVSAPLIAMTLIALVACAEEPRQADRRPEPRGEIAAPDPLEGWDWSSAKVDSLIASAKAGDIEDGRRLAEYYSVQGDAENTRYWDDWLFERGDRRAIMLRAETLFLTAEKRPNGDPRKLGELREAERLFLSIYPPKGKYGDDHFLDNVRSEIDSMQSRNVE